ncbi:hypothetical protein XJ18_17635 [Bacillus pumilus]|nr:hypothetical protein XJ18_17635 [Bacillus pumilus]
MNFQFGPHARKALKDRFGITNYYASYKWLAERLSSSVDLGVSVDKNGKEARMYGAGDAIILCDINEDFVITVLKPRRFNPVFVRKVYQAEKQSVEERIQYNDRLSSELPDELSHWQRELKRTRSAAKKRAIQARINAIQARLDELPNETFEARRDLTRVAQAVAAYV